MEARPGYRAVRDGVGLLPEGTETGLPAQRPRGLVRVLGPEAAAFLNRIMTQELASLAPGRGAPACLTDRMGKIQAPATAWRDGEDFWLETDPGREELLAKKLAMYALGSRVEFERWGARRAALGVRGPGAEALVRGLGLPLPEAGRSCRVEQGIRVHRIEDPAAPGFDLWVPSEEAGAWRARILGAGAVLVEPESREALRVEAGRAVFGVDYDEARMPVEVGLEDAVARNKGCYVGQEILERLFSRNVVTRLLRLVRLEGDGLPSGTPAVLRDGVELGSLTSAVVSPRAGAVLGLASLPAAKAEPGDEVRVEGRRGVVMAAPLAL